MKSKIRYCEGYKYQLVESYIVEISIKPVADIITTFIKLNRDGMLAIMAGYAWDGPSGPAFDTSSFMRGSLIHDALYQLIRLNKLPKKYKEVADLLLKEICLEDGMWKFRAWYVHRAVKRLGIFSCRPGSEKEARVYSAPEDQ